MPYKVKGKCVYKKDTGKKVGCTKGSVKKYLAALHMHADESLDRELTKEELEEIIQEELQKPLPQVLIPGRLGRDYFDDDYYDPLVPLSKPQRPLTDSERIIQALLKNLTIDDNMVKYSLRFEAQKKINYKRSFKKHLQI